MQRALGSFERAQVATGRHAPYNAVVALRLARAPSAEAVAAALGVVARRHPLLTARVETHAGRELFVVDDRAGSPPLTVDSRGDDDAWRGAVEGELNRGFDIDAGPLLRGHLLAPPGGAGRGELVLSMPHAVVDAAGFVTICRELLAVLGGAAPAALEGGREPELGPCPDDRFPARLRGARRLPSMLGLLMRQAGDEIAYRWRTRSDRRPEVCERTTCRVHLLELGREATAAVEQRARRQRLTLSSVLNAALLLAVRRHLYGGRARALRYFAFPDLRGSLRPRVPADQLGSFMTVVRLTARLDGDDLWGLAHRLHPALREGLRRDERFLAALVSPHLMRFFLSQRRQRMGAAAVSFTGATGLEVDFGSVRLDRLHAFVSNFPIGPEYAGQARLFRGRLLWDIVYLEPELDAATAGAVAEEIRARLTAAPETA